jgi:hypothetical protein
LVINKELDLIAQCVGSLQPRVSDIVPLFRKGREPFHRRPDLNVDLTMEQRGQAKERRDELLRGRADRSWRR